MAENENDANEPKNPQTWQVPPNADVRHDIDGTTTITGWVSQ
jgi:hypothetical protein